MTENTISSLQWWARELNFPSSCDVAVLSQTWTLGMAWEGARSPVCWCISGQTLFGSSVFEEKIKIVNHIGITPFGGFNYIYSIFIPHCNSTQLFPGTVESRKPDVVYQHLFGKQTHLTVEMFWKQTETIPSTPNKSKKCQSFILHFGWITFGHKWYLVIVSLLTLFFLTFQVIKLDS